MYSDIILRNPNPHRDCILCFSTLVFSRMESICNCYKIRTVLSWTIHIIHWFPPTINLKKYILLNMNERIADIWNGALLLNAISHSEGWTLFCIFVSSRMESIHVCYKTRTISFLNNRTYCTVFHLYCYKYNTLYLGKWINCGWYAELCNSPKGQYHRQKINIVLHVGG
jgi:hypothetical protein